MVRLHDRFVAVPGNHPVKVLLRLDALPSIEVPAGAGALRNPRVAAAPRSPGGGLRFYPSSALDWKHAHFAVAFDCRRLHRFHS